MCYNLKARHVQNRNEMQQTNISDIIKVNGKGE